jgi:hypothetical protein
MRPALVLRTTTAPDTPYSSVRTRSTSTAASALKNAKSVIAAYPGEVPYSYIELMFLLDATSGSLREKALLLPLLYTKLTAGCHIGREGTELIRQRDRL